jgi:hypothetical protein
MGTSCVRKSIRMSSAAFQMCVHRVNQREHLSVWDAVFDTTTSGTVWRRPAPCPTVGRCRRISCRAFTPFLTTASQLWKREQSREKGVNVVAMTVHGYRRFGEPYCLQHQCRSASILQNLLVGCVAMWVTGEYQFSEEHVAWSRWKYLYTKYCVYGGFEIL